MGSRHPIFRCRIALAPAILAMTLPACAREAQVAEHSEEIASYVGFLAAHESAIDYVVGLFDEAEIVVLCERFHPEVTQYELILSLVEDPRFQERVGHVFTEIGSSRLRPAVAELMNTDGLSADDADALRRDIYRNFSARPIWEAANYYDFLGRLWAVNRDLPADRRVALHPSDIPFDWDGMTREGWAEFQGGPLRERDRIMADQIASRIRAAREQGDARSKALVIMNFRHAFPNLELRAGGRTRLMENTTGFLMEEFPGEVRNVLLNTVKLSLAASDRDASLSPIQDGRWDAAFEVVGNPSVGFDFAGSPFGADTFDLFPIGVDHLTYRDVFTGFVFHEPLSRHVMAHGIPGVVDSTFTDELVRRFLLVGDFDTEEAARDSAAVLTTRHESGYEAFPAESPLQQTIEQWLVPARIGSDPRTS